MIARAQSGLCQSSTASGVNPQTSMFARQIGHLTKWQLFSHSVCVGDLLRCAGRKNRRNAKKRR
jgi:hypothetical protein